MKKTGGVSVLVAVALAVTAAIAQEAQVTEFEDLSIEGENHIGVSGTNINRTAASGAVAGMGFAHLLLPGETVEYNAVIESPGAYVLRVRYSNDDAGPGDDVLVKVNGKRKARFHAVNTRGPKTKLGDGWNVFTNSPDMAIGQLEQGENTVALILENSDGYGVEIDRLDFFFKADDMQTPAKKGDAE